MAYGEAGSGELIPPNEALTFLVEVRAVIPPPDPANAPTEAGVPASEGATETTVVDLQEGDGEELQPGQTGIINYVLFRGDNLVRAREQLGSRSCPGRNGCRRWIPRFRQGSARHEGRWSPCDHRAAGRRVSARRATLSSGCPPART